jgi:hypothetical protein
MFETIFQSNQRENGFIETPIKLFHIYRSLIKKI